MRNNKELLKYKLKKFHSSYFCLRYIKITFDEEIAKVKSEFDFRGYDHNGVPSKELDKDQMVLIELLKKEFENVETDLYDISFEIPNYEEYIEKIKKDIISNYSEKWAIQIIKTKNSGYFGDNIDIDYIEEIEVETKTFDSKEEAIIEYHLLKNSYDSLDYDDIKLIKVIEE